MQPKQTGIVPEETSASIDATETIPKVVEAIEAKDAEGPVEASKVI
jgi:hypothetical protein